MVSPTGRRSLRTNGDREVTMYGPLYGFTLGEYPPRADRVWTAVTVALLGSAATVAAAVGLDRHEDVSRLWWVAVGVAVVCGAVSAMAALVLLIQRLHYRRGVRRLARRLRRSAAVQDELIEAALDELREATGRGDLGVAVVLDRALAGRRPRGRRYEDEDVDDDEEPEPPRPRYREYGGGQDQSR